MRICEPKAGGPASPHSKLDEKEMYLCCPPFKLHSLLAPSVVCCPRQGPSPDKTLACLSALKGSTHSLYSGWYQNTISTWFTHSYHSNFINTLLSLGKGKVCLVCICQEGHTLAYTVKLSKVLEVAYKYCGTNILIIPSSRCLVPHFLVQENCLPVPYNKNSISIVCVQLYTAIMLFYIKGILYKYAILWGNIQTETGVTDSRGPWCGTIYPLGLL